VVRAHITQREALESSLKVLEGPKVKILGVVLNGVRIEKAYYHYYRHYHYGYEKKT